MRQYRFILFKDGSPWKGFYDEVDFINEYEKGFEDLQQEYAEWGLYESVLVHEVVIPEFFWRFQPVRYEGSARRFVSLLREYIIGANPNEGSVVYGIDWEDLGLREQGVFNFIDRHFDKILKDMPREDILRMPKFGVGRGTKNLSRL